MIAFEDLTPERRFDLGTVTVDGDEMLAFNRRFDPQPFHVDADAARSSLMGGLCASGWFTAGLWMRCYVDRVLDGSTSLGSPGGDEIAWPAPVFPGDTLTAAMEVLAARRSSSRPELGLVTLRGTLTKPAPGNVPVAPDSLPVAPLEVFRARFTGMFGLRAADA